MSTKESKVGILIRTKNRPLCLERAIYHIISQTFKNWHIHVLNDGGRLEDVEHIISKYEKEISGRITVYSNRESVGRGNALSQLISYCTEDYLLINDDDDTIEPDFLKRTSEFLDENEKCVGVVTSNYDVFEKIENNEIKVISKVSEFGKRSTLFIDYLSYVASDIAIIPICLLFRRTTIYMSGSVDGNLNYMEDYDFFTRLLMHGEFGIIIDTLASYHHRIDNNSDYDTTRNIMLQGHHDLYFNKKLRSAISGNDNLSKFICQSLVETRNKKLILEKLDTNHKNTIETILLLKEAVKLLVERNIKIEQSVQKLCHILTEKHIK